MQLVHGQLTTNNYVTIALAMKVTMHKLHNCDIFTKLFSVEI